MQRQQNLASICLPILVVGMVVGCRVPNWCAYRSLGSVPCTADVSSRPYFEQCSETGSVESPGDKTLSPLIPAMRDETKGQLRQGDSPLTLPKEFPGAATPPLSLPRNDADGRPLDPAQQKENILKLYAEFPALPFEPFALPDASHGLIGLEELQQIARENHPGLRASAASVEAARGLMIQAGLPPNPNFGYEADTVRTLNTPGYHGAYLQQTFITARKLGLAAQAAAVDYANAEVNQWWQTGARHLSCLAC